MWSLAGAASGLRKDAEHHLHPSVECGSHERILHRQAVHLWVVAELLCNRVDVKSMIWRNEEHMQSKSAGWVVGPAHAQQEGACCAVTVDSQAVVQAAFGEQLKGVEQVDAQSTSATVAGIDGHLDQLRPAIQSYGGSVKVRRLLMSTSE